MGWREQVDVELARIHTATEAGKWGRARTSARRAAGIMVTAYRRARGEHPPREDAISQLQWVVGQEFHPEVVREAASRLAARLAEDFTAQSLDPMADARLIINHFMALMTP